MNWQENGDFPQNHSILLPKKTHPFFSKSVDNLRAKGFVVLIEDDNDRRKRHIELTQKAEEAAKEMLEVHNDCKRIIMRYVTEEEKTVMDRVMQKMLRSLDEELQK